MRPRKQLAFWGAIYVPFKKSGERACSKFKASGISKN